MSSVAVMASGSMTRPLTGRFVVARLTAARAFIDDSSLRPSLLLACRIDACLHLLLRGRLRNTVARTACTGVYRVFGAGPGGEGDRFRHGLEKGHELPRLAVSIHLIARRLIVVVTVSSRCVAGLANDVVLGHPNAGSGMATFINVAGMHIIDHDCDPHWRLDHVPASLSRSS